ncbi:MAG: winged helix-turn-helix transcriptional regulator [Phenylobacterium sp.]|uniref:winged helix-turn-helix transcriptional regulator n=1 Tax=Phenylobacterium sp. TaxID=1871053 RepID=UPI003918A90F
MAGPGPMQVTIEGVVHVLGECRRFAPVLSRLGDKWTLLVIMTLRGGPRRFNQLRRGIEGVSQQMLTRTLKSLERDGLVLRTVLPANPPQVQYELTELGRSLSVPILALGDWARDHLDEIEAARAAFDRRADGMRPGD